MAVPVINCNVSEVSVLRYSHEQSHMADKKGCCHKTCAQAHRNRQVEPLSSWVTLAAAFMVNIVVASTDTFGIFYEYFIEKYDATRSEVGWAISVSVASGSLFGMVVSPVYNILGCRPVAVASTFTFALGMCLISLAPNLASLIVFYGVIGAVVHTVIPMVIVDVVGVTNMPKGFVLIRIFSMPFCLAAAPFSGWLVDITGAYTVMFIVVGALSSISVFLILGSELLMRRTKTELTTNAEADGSSSKNNIEMS